MKHKQQVEDFFKEKRDKKLQGQSVQAGSRGPQDASRFVTCLNPDPTNQQTKQAPSPRASWTSSCARSRRPRSNRPPRTPPSSAAPRPRPRPGPRPRRRGRLLGARC